MERKHRHSDIPVTIIGGYLGSGKTTLVNHLLRNADGARLAVLVNDFGELSIDADLIEARDDDVISLSGGCICCSYGDDLSLSLQKLQDQELQPSHVLIEASGVALPGAIGQSLSLLRAYQLVGIVVIADATTIQSSAVQRYVGDTIQRQLSDADLIVLNKLDLLCGDRAETTKKWLADNFPQAPLIDATFSMIEPEILLAVHNSDSVQIRSHDSSFAHDISSLFNSLSLIIHHAVDATALAARLADKRLGLVRAKGFVRDHDDTMKSIQVVGQRWSVANAPAGVTSGLVCIARTEDLVETEIRATVQSAISN